MIGSSSERDGHEHDAPNRPGFLDTHRALAACTREFARLSEAVAQEVAALASANDGEKVVLRQSPERCIVQFGPVALTVAWLRRTLDSVATGELLVIVWRGIVAPTMKQRPERMREAPVPIAATALWERVFAAEANSEENWSWQPLDPAIARCSSLQLAHSSVERLRTAYVESRSAA